MSKLSRLRYEGGQTTFKDVLDAELQLLQVESRLGQSRQETLLSLISVYRAMGGGWMLEVDKRRAVTVPPSEVQAQATSQKEALQK